jgi:hypothetical protein
MSICREDANSKHLLLAFLKSPSRISLSYLLFTDLLDFLTKSSVLVLVHHYIKISGITCNQNFVHLEGKYHNQTQ